MTAARKRNTVAALALVLVAAMIIGITYAYFTAEDEIVNTFVMGDLEIDLEEPNYPGDPDPDNPDNPEPYEPGDVLEKDPTVEAVENDSYVRLFVKFVGTEDNAAAFIAKDSARLNKILSIIFYDKTGTAIVPNIYKGVSAGAGRPDSPASRYSTTQLATIVSTGAADNWYNKTDFAAPLYNATTGEFEFRHNAELKEGDSLTLFNRVVFPTNWDLADFHGDDTVNPAIVGIGNFKIEVRAEAIQSKNFATADEAFAALNAQIAANNP